MKPRVDEVAMAGLVQRKDEEQRAGLVDEARRNQRRRRHLRLLPPRHCSGSNHLYLPSCFSVSHSLSQAYERPRGSQPLVLVPAPCVLQPAWKVQTTTETAQCPQIPQAGTGRAVGVVVGVVQAVVVSWLRWVDQKTCPAQGTTEQPTRRHCRLDS